MPRIQMVALKAFAPGGRRVQIGDFFTVSGETEARLLEAIKSAARIAGSAAADAMPSSYSPAPRHPGESREPLYRPLQQLQIAPAEQPAPDPEPIKKPRRTYFRRDLTAEASVPVSQPAPADAPEA